MQHFLQPSTSFTAALRIGRFLHFSQLSPSVRIPMFADCAAFRELEAYWFNCCPGLREALFKVLNDHETKYYKHVERQHAMRLNRLEGLVRASRNENASFLGHFKVRDDRHEKKVEELIQEGRNLIDAALEHRTKRMKLTGRYNVSGTLSRMVWSAKMQKKIPPEVGIQQGLEMLAQGREFSTFLQEEVQGRRLRVEDVMTSVSHLYEQVSDGTHGNDDTCNDTIIVRCSKFSDNERAALVIFLKIQSTWPNPINWRENK